MDYGAYRGRNIASERQIEMEKLIEHCPGCHKEVWIEPIPGQVYRCRHCGQLFTYVPDSASGGHTEPRADDSSPQEEPVVLFITAKARLVDQHLVEDVLVITLEIQPD